MALYKVNQPQLHISGLASEVHGHLGVGGEMQEVTWDNHTDPGESSPPHDISALMVVFTGVVLIVIICTVLGNILVIAAVCYERRLRKVGNLFLVSLAVADLMVGMLVTPLALAYQLAGRWGFSQALCDFWVSVDVICCTASIVNLCVISFDRYNAITRPLHYALRRTPLRAAGMIAGVWAYSTAIALPPLLGWRTPNPAHSPGLCAVSQDWGYTIYSTVGAFYTPLIIMLIMYIRVFRATLKRRRHWIPGNTQRWRWDQKRKQLKLTETSVLINATDSIRRHYELAELACAKKPKLKPKHRTLAPVNPRVGYRLMKTGDPGCSSSVESLPDVDFDMSDLSSGLSTQVSPAHSSSRVHGAKARRLLFKLRSKTTMSTTLNTSCSLEVSPELSRPTSNSTSSLTKPSQLCVESHGPSDGYVTTTTAKRNHSKLMRSRNHGFRHPKSSTSHGESSSLPNQAKHKLIFRRTGRRGKICVSQERRAARTLGVIMGGFVLCWTPFFIVTLIQPFCSSCKFPELLLDAFTWLGYFNSTLNPIIYTFFNQDFRRAFRKMLCCSKSK